MSSASSTSTSAYTEMERRDNQAREALIKITDSQILSVEQKAEQVKKINFEGSIREGVVCSKLDLLLEEMDDQFEGLELDEENGVFLYDSSIISTRFILLPLFNYMILADVLAYLLSFEWDYIKDICGFCISAAITPRTIFLQSSEAAEMVRSKHNIMSIIIKAFMNKGIISYGLLAAIGQVLLETNMFNSNSVVKFYQSVIRAPSIMRCITTNFPEGSRARTMIEVLRTKIDMNKFNSLAMIATGFIKIHNPDKHVTNVDIRMFSVDSMASCNVRDTNIIRTHDFRTKETILKRNSIENHDDHLQIDNITRAIFGKEIIRRNMSEEDIRLIKVKINILR